MTSDPPASQPGMQTTRTGEPDKRTLMAPELRERREQTWELLYIEDTPYGEVVTQLAAEYGVAEATIRSDIARMDDWLPKLSAATNSAHSRLRELERNQQRRRDLLDELQAEKTKPDDESNYSRQQELRLLDEIDQAAELYVDLAQSIGSIQREPQKHVTTHEGTVDHTLSEQQEAHFRQLKEQAREATIDREPDVIDVENIDDTDTDTEAETEAEAEADPDTDAEDGA